MKTFRDFVLNDIAVFVNPKEFGSVLTIEGESVNVVLDDEKMVERQLAKQLEGLHKEELLFYVEKSKITFYPRPDNVVRFDNVVWKISQVQEDEGLFTITAERVSG